MVYGAINRKGESYYTYLGKFFGAMGGRQKDYNWLITDCECYPSDPKAEAMLRGDSCWISGEALTALVERENFQWIWAVLSGFDKHVSLREVLAHPLPYADGYPGFWRLPLTMQHPLAQLEIVAWDSSLTLFFSREKGLTARFRQAYPQSQALEDYLQE